MITVELSLSFILMMFHLFSDYLPLELKVLG